MKQLFAALLCLLLTVQAFTCAWYDPEYEYFNLFTQDMLEDKTFTPFLLTYDPGFYNTDDIELPDTNIEEWQTYFGNKLNYKETAELVYKMSIDDLNALKYNRPQKNNLLKQFNSSFYNQHKDGIDYLIEAKFLQPYMRFASENVDDFYDKTERIDASSLDYDKITNDLKSLYNATQDAKIKLRYGYQLVRFNHYTRNYDAAITAFKNYVAPLNLKTTLYYYALDQMAGAQNGLGLTKEANWNFFQVFCYAPNLKQSAYKSMKFADIDSFDYLLNQAKNDHEKIMAYFVLGYQSFNNPLPMMKQIKDINPNSEVLKVLEARAINELERNLLPLEHYDNVSYGQIAPENSYHNNTDIPEETVFPTEKQSLWQKIVAFFKNLFGNKPPQKAREVVKRAEEGEPLENDTTSYTIEDLTYIVKPELPPLKQQKQYTNTLRSAERKKLPIAENATIWIEEEEIPAKKQLQALINFTDKMLTTDDPYWEMAFAYLKFLDQDYKTSQSVLANINTSNKTYSEQIDKMKMLNDLVKQPLIDSKFEEHLMQKYASVLTEVQTKNNYYAKPDTKDFVIDILANRYFVQNEDAKAFLMHNPLTMLEYSPNVELTKQIEKFYHKKNKSTFEQQIIMEHFDVADPSSFFNLLYGDAEMRNGNFAQAENFYEKVENGKGFLPKGYDDWDYETNTKKFVVFPPNTYDKYNNISRLVFGHNQMVSYQSEPNKTMVAEPFIEEFEFIKPYMNKEELSAVLLKLREIGNGNDERASQANQLIGNLFYNTSKIGYFRHLFVMDMDNSNGGKYHFKPQESISHTYYYKNFWSNEFFEKDVFDIAIAYYRKAYQQSEYPEQQARILFQLASAEQGLFYQWEANQPGIDYDDYKNYEDYSNAIEQKQHEIASVEHDKFRIYFNLLKENYKDSKTEHELRETCTQFDYFMSQ